MHRSLVRLLAGGVALFVSSAWGAGCIYTGSKWPSPSAAMYVATAVGTFIGPYQQATQIWDTDTVFAFSVAQDPSADPCSDPKVSTPRNGVSFDSTNCGEAWGAGVLATTHWWTVTSTGTTIQAGTEFNGNLAWSVYSGPWVSGQPEFRRTAVHELGHVIGLDHDDSVPSIMHTYFSGGDPLETPTAHDIACVDTLYGAAAPPSVRMNLESPIQGGVSSGVSNIRGWAVGLSGIDHVELYIDGQFYGNIPSGGRRDDVAAAYPAYPGSFNAGFSMAYNYGNLPAGTHTMSVTAVGKDSATASASATFDVVRFDNAFISDASAVSLAGASAFLTPGAVQLSRVLAGGTYYDITLVFRPETQRLEPVQIVPSP
jgi:hypothetical protein